MLIGEGEYNLNDLKEIEITDSYLGLDREVRECQNVEPLYNCTTRHYHDAIMEECGCLPVNIRLSHKVNQVFVKFPELLDLLCSNLGTPLHC